MKFPNARLNRRFVASTLVVLLAACGGGNPSHLGQGAETLAVDDLAGARGAAAEACRQATDEEIVQLQPSI